MKIVVKARHMEVTDAIRDYVESKASRLPRFYDQIQSIEITLGMEAEKPTAEAVVTASRKSTFVARERNGNMYACIDLCIDKIAEQLRRHKGKVRDHQAPTHEARDSEVA